MKIIQPCFHYAQHWTDDIKSLKRISTASWNSRSLGKLLEFYLRSKRFLETSRSNSHGNCCGSALWAPFSTLCDLSSPFAHIVTGSLRVTVLVSRRLQDLFRYPYSRAFPSPHFTTISIVLLPNLPFYRPPDFLLLFYLRSKRFLETSRSNSHGNSLNFAKILAKWPSRIVNFMDFLLLVSLRLFLFCFHP